MPRLLRDDTETTTLFTSATSVCKIAEFDSPTESIKRHDTRREPQCLIPWLFTAVSL